MQFVLPILVFLFAVVAASAADDADTLTVNDTRYHLDGIDAPEIDQPCLDEEGGEYPCGQAAAKALQEFIGSRRVHCEDFGADPKFSDRRIGRCLVAGTDLHKWLVRRGFALSFEPNARGRFKDDERHAREQGLGMWKGCFVAPWDFRRWNKNAPLLGASCSHDARAKLFRALPDMPPGCEIKGKYAVRAKLTGHVGIYHVPGCGSYRRTVRVDRWFCSEGEAIAAGFRLSFTCWLK